MIPFGKALLKLHAMCEEIVILRIKELHMCLYLQNRLTVISC